ncbi:MAG: DNRLRE domain-containing protein, partial [Gemmatimonadetes bacterium]|nr:DNRLRE domain-containing protein [Gemmatimonadota bacterium]
MTVRSIAKETSARRSVRRPVRLLAVSLTVAAVFATAADAQTVIVPLDSAFTDDAHINRDAPNRSLGDNNNFRVGFNNDDLKRGVFRFETSLVPSPGTATSVQLVLKINDNYLDGYPMVLHAYSLAERFIEGTGINGYDVSWNDRMNDIPWSVPGGNWDPGKLSRATVQTWHDSLVLDITTQFQAWVADTSENHGLILGDSLYFANPSWNYDNHGI